MKTDWLKLVTAFIIIFGIGIRRVTPMNECQLPKTQKKLGGLILLTQDLAHHTSNNVD